MTYWQFHLLFNLPIFLILLFLVRRRLRKAHFLWIGVVAVIALLATTPWDNWAVAQGIWGFDWERTTPIEVSLWGTLWRLPLEEYSFFIIEVVIVGLFTVLCLPIPVDAKAEEEGGAQ